MDGRKPLVVSRGWYLRGLVVILLCAVVVGLILIIVERRQDILRKQSPFLVREGSSLQYRGETYRFVGVNAYGLATCEGYTYTEGDMSSLFAALPEHTVTRTWATSRATFEELDRVVAAAEAANQMLIFSLVDGANYCNRDGKKLDRAFYQNGYRSEYLEWIRSVVPRYADSPAVAIWEIANEPGWDCEGKTCDVTKDELKQFFDESAALIRSLDPNHLIGTGTIGKEPKAIEKLQDFAYVHSGKDIDILSIHEYEYDHNGNRNAQYWFSTGKTAAENLDKPIIIGETGAYLDQPNNVTCRDSSVSLNDFAEKKIHSYLSQGANGVLLWGWLKAQPEWVADGCEQKQHFFYGYDNPVFQVLRARMPKG